MPYNPPQMSQFPITTQPTSEGGIVTQEWMSMPQHVPNCPPGLEYLTMLDNLLVYQMYNMNELNFPIPGYHGKGKFVICNPLEQRIYFAEEVSDWCGRQCWGSNRSFDISVTDNNSREVIRMHRPWGCQAVCCPCCLVKIEVSCPPDNPVGVVEELWSCNSKFVIKNSNGDIVFHMKGPPCCYSSCQGPRDEDYKILSSDETTEVGKISRKWPGFDKQLYTNADDFGIAFPMDLDVGMKAVLLGACFLINMMYYEAIAKARPRNGY